MSEILTHIADNVKDNKLSKEDFTKADNSDRVKTVKELDALKEKTKKEEVESIYKEIQKTYHETYTTTKNEFVNFADIIKNKKRGDVSKNSGLTESQRNTLQHIYAGMRTKARLESLSKGSTDFFSGSTPESLEKGFYDTLIKIIQNKKWNEFVAWVMGPETATTNGNNNPNTGNTNTGNTNTGNTNTGNTNTGNTNTGNTNPEVVTDNIEQKIKNYSYEGKDGRNLNTATITKTTENNRTVYIGVFKDNNKEYKLMYDQYGTLSTVDGIVPIDGRIDSASQTTPAPADTELRYFRQVGDKIQVFSHHDRKEELQDIESWKNALKNKVTIDGKELSEPLQLQKVGPNRFRLNYELKGQNLRAEFNVKPDNKNFADNKNIFDITPATPKEIIVENNGKEEIHDINYTPTGTQINIESKLNEQKTKDIVEKKIKTITLDLGSTYNSQIDTIKDINNKPGAEFMKRISLSNDITNNPDGTFSRQLFIKNKSGFKTIPVGTISFDAKGNVTGNTQATVEVFGIKTDIPLTVANNRLTFDTTKTLNTTPLNDKIKKLQTSLINNEGEKTAWGIVANANADLSIAPNLAKLDNTTAHTDQLKQTLSSPDIDGSFDVQISSRNKITLMHQTGDTRKLRTPSGDAGDVYPFDDQGKKCKATINNNSLNISPLKENESYSTEPTINRSPRGTSPIGTLGTDYSLQTAEKTLSYISKNKNETRMTLPITKTRDGQKDKRTLDNTQLSQGVNKPTIDDFYNNIERKRNEVKNVLGSVKGNDTVLKEIFQTKMEKERIIEGMENIIKVKTSTGKVLFYKTSQNRDGTLEMKEDTDTQEKVNQIIENIKSEITTIHKINTEMKFADPEGTAYENTNTLTLVKIDQNDAKTFITTPEYQRKMNLKQTISYQENGETREAGVITYNLRKRNGKLLISIKEASGPNISKPRFRSDYRLTIGDNKRRMDLPKNDIGEVGNDTNMKIYLHPEAVKQGVTTSVTPTNTKDNK